MNYMIVMILQKKVLIILEIEHWTFRFSETTPFNTSGKCFLYTLTHSHLLASVEKTIQRHLVPVIRKRRIVPTHSCSTVCLFCFANSSAKSD